MNLNVAARTVAAVCFPALFALWWFCDRVEAAADTAATFGYPD